MCAALIALVSCVQIQPPNGCSDKPAPAQTVTMDNSPPRRDEVGNIIDAHDGCLQFFAGR
jgi:hypothetical protein